MDKLLTVAIEEITHPTFGVTEQFLATHELVYESGQPMIAGLKVNTEEEYATVYFSVVGERFHFVVYVNTQPEIQVRGTDTQDYCQVYFRATSEELTLQQLANFTSLPPSGGWSKGDLRGKGSATYSFSSLVLELPQEPGELYAKLKPLLSYLAQDLVGIRLLADKYYGIIQVHTIFHNGNTMLGGLHLDRADIQQLAALNLEIDFDLYAEGNFFKE